MHLHKITVVSGIVLHAYFSLGMAKFDTLSNLSLAFVNNMPISLSNYKITQFAILNM